MNSYLQGYELYRGDFPTRQTGALVADRGGKVTGYAVQHLQDRGTLFVGPSDEVYAGMIVGENSREQNMDINITKEKKLTNMRAAGSDRKMRIAPPVKLSLEEALEHINHDELVEVTPNHLRLRKVLLDENDRKRAQKQVKLLDA